jgi:tetratricopeptide (TPR) repeat protein
MQMRSRVVACLLLVVALAARPVVAATPEEKAKARELFQSGLVHYDLKEYPEALSAFRDAYRVVQDPAFLFNIAQCYRRLGQNPEALDFYRNYLRRSPSASNRAEVERRIQEIEREIQSGRTTSPGPSTPKATTSPPVLTPRPPEPTTAPPAESKPPAATPAPAPTTAPPATVALTANPPPPEKEGGAIYTRWWFWTAIGAVVASGIAIGFAVSQRGQIGDCRDLPASMCRTVGP